jgi:hypothetical protein
MGTLLHDRALIHQQNSIGMADTVQAMGDEEHGTRSKRVGQVTANLPLCVVVEGAGGFIQNEETGIL